MSKPTQNLQLVFGSAVTTLQTDFAQYKKLLKKSIDAYFVTSDGRWGWVDNNYGEEIQRMVEVLKTDVAECDRLRELLEKKGGEKDDDNRSNQRD